MSIRSRLLSHKSYLFWSLGLRMSLSPTHSLHYLFWDFWITHSPKGLNPYVSFQRKTSCPPGNPLLKAHLVEHFLQSLQQICEYLPLILLSLNSTKSSPCALLALLLMKVEQYLSWASPRLNYLCQCTPRKHCALLALKNSKKRNNWNLFNTSLHIQTMKYIKKW